MLWWQLEWLIQIAMKSTNGKANSFQYLCFWDASSEGEIKINIFFIHVEGEPRSHLDFPWNKFRHRSQMTLDHWCTRLLHRHMKLHCAPAPQTVYRQYLSLNPFICRAHSRRIQILDVREKKNRVVSPDCFLLASQGQNNIERIALFLVLDFESFLPCECGSCWVQGASK